jgi:hypothetical protein
VTCWRWQATAVYARAVAFEKQHGDRTGIEDIIVGERRFQYEDEVGQSSSGGDTLPLTGSVGWASSPDHTQLESLLGDVAGGSQPTKLRHLV